LTSERQEASFQHRFQPALDCHGGRSDRRPRRTSTRRVGAGPGYATAVLYRLAAKVYRVEANASMAAKTAAFLRSL
jgi:hypothetical protein